MSISSYRGELVGQNAIMRCGRKINQFLNGCDVSVTLTMILTSAIQLIGESEVNKPKRKHTSCCPTALCLIIFSSLS